MTTKTVPGKRTGGMDAAVMVAGLPPVVFATVAAAVRRIADAAGIAA